MSTREYSDLDRSLLNDFQRGLPLSPTPFADMAESLGVEEAEVIVGLRRLQDSGVVSRVGPVLRPNRVGTSTLAAMAVPPELLELVGALVSAYREVNHNYEREHRLNLWFVVTADSCATIERVLNDIEDRTGLPVMDLPMLEDYFIDLGFELQWT